MSEPGPVLAVFRGLKEEYYISPSDAASPPNSSPFDNVNPTPSPSSSYHTPSIGGLSPQPPEQEPNLVYDGAGWLQVSLTLVALASAVSCL